jgi:beta-barrel assembly-enhancing protease
MGERGGGARLLVALVIAVISVAGYLGTRQKNPVTGETQHVAMSLDQEVALGRKAAPELAEQFGGPSRDRQASAQVEAVGRRLVERSDVRESRYRFAFHLLADRQTINAFALPGGQVFITEALAGRLRTEGELAGVLGHEIGHVVGRHGSEHLAKAQLLQGLGAAGVIAASDPNDPGRSHQNQMLAAAITQLISMKFGREDELESDRLGVRYMAQAGYDPHSLMRVMEVLKQASRGRQPEFVSTHPYPERRIERIREEIRKQFPQGLPSGLQK